MLTLVSPILLGAALNLDKQMVGPFMLSRPLVVGLVFGILIGDFHMGVWMGLSVELLWLGAVPLGGSLSPNAGLAVSAALAAWAGQSLLGGTAFPSPGPGGGQMARAALALLFFTVPLWARLFSLLDIVARALVPPQIAAARADLEAGREPHFFRRNLLGVGVNFLAGLLALSLAVPLNIFFLKLMGAVASLDFLLALSTMFSFIPFLGLFGMAVFLETKTLTHYLGGLLAGLLVLSAI